MSESRHSEAAFESVIEAHLLQNGYIPMAREGYVDKWLAGIQAVQTLSRLNRTHSLKEDAFVLDFVNDRAEICAAFKVYYEGTEMGAEVDPARMYAVKGLHLATRKYRGRRWDGPRRWGLLQH